MKSMGDLLDLGIFLVILGETVTKYLSTMLAITAGSDLMLPFESLSVFIVVVDENQDL